MNTLATTVKSSETCFTPGLDIREPAPPAIDPSVRESIVKKILACATPELECTSQSKRDPIMFCAGGGTPRYET